MDKPEPSCNPRSVAPNLLVALKAAQSLLNDRALDTRSLNVLDIVNAAIAEAERQ